MAGYTLRVREPDWYEHRMFKGQSPTVNLHVFSQGCDKAQRMLAFRDHLRSHAADRERYAAEKRRARRAEMDVRSGLRQRQDSRRAGDPGAHFRSAANFHTINPKRWRTIRQRFLLPAKPRYAAIPANVILRCLPFPPAFRILNTVPEHKYSQGVESHCSVTTSKNTASKKAGARKSSLCG